MRKMVLSLTMVSLMALLPAAAQAGQYEQRVITTTTILGATTGAVIGSGNDQTAQGAVIGALVGATAGMVLTADEPHRVYAPRHARYVEREYRPQYRERHYRQPYRIVHVHRYGPREMVRVRYVRDGYGRMIKRVVHIHERHRDRYDRDGWYDEEAREHRHHDRDYARNW